MPADETTIGSVADLVTAAFDPLIQAGLVVVLVIFILIYRDDLRDWIASLVGHGRLTFTTDAVSDGARRISRYLLRQLYVNTAFGTAVGLGLWIIGMTLGKGEGGFPNVILGGDASALLCFVPYVGVWIAAAFPLVLAFGLFDSNSVFFATAVLFVGLEILISQFLEPVIYGPSAGLSAVAVLLAAIFWTALWGPIGLVLSTPLTWRSWSSARYDPQLEFLQDRPGRQASAGGRRAGLSSAADRGSDGAARLAGIVTSSPPAWRKRSSRCCWARWPTLRTTASEDAWARNDSSPSSRAWARPWTGS